MVPNIYDVWGAVLRRESDLACVSLVIDGYCREDVSVRRLRGGRIEKHPGPDQDESTKPLPLDLPDCFASPL